MTQQPQPYRNIVSWLAPLGRWVRRSGVALAMAIALMVTGLTGCGSRAEDDGPKTLKSQQRGKSRIEVVAPPALIQQLDRLLERYQPQVKFLEPRRGGTFNSDAVTVKLSVQDLPLFKDEELGLGPHIVLIVDDQCYGPIFDVSEPIVLEDLAPGTHTLRAFAERPWYESFKNEGAYAQVTFNVFAGSRNNNPDPKKPLLTYSQPAGTVGTEPVLLDFYLNNAPLHWVAREDAQDDIEDWRVQATINGETFVLDTWQSVYLKGLKPGQNWVELELLGDGGEPLDNVYNDTVKVVTLDPTAVTNITRLFTGELAYEDALAIVDPDYVRPEPEPEPEPEVIPEPEEDMIPTPEVAPESDVIPEVEPEMIPEEEPEAIAPSESEAELETAEDTDPESLQVEAKLDEIEAKAEAKLEEIEAKAEAKLEEIEAILEESDRPDAVVDTPEPQVPEMEEPPAAIAPEPAESVEPAEEPAPEPTEADVAEPEVLDEPEMVDEPEVLDDSLGESNETASNESVEEAAPAEIPMAETEAAETPATDDPPVTADTTEPLKAESMDSAESVGEDDAVETPTEDEDTAAEETVVEDTLEDASPSLEEGDRADVEDPDFQSLEVDPSPMDDPEEPDSNPVLQPDDDVVRVIQLDDVLDRGVQKLGQQVNTLLDNGPFQ
ncbi:MAG: hypothetical protein AAGF75_03950 [Cyanobacteria bacterium P01_H01_bin.130]